jgi:DNA replication initiation complex subunit (GINS family)
MEDQNIIISYETLFELLRLERSRTELQKIPSNFIHEVESLVTSEINAINTVEDSEKRKREINLKSTLKIIKEIYERRERKIVIMALDKSKTKSAIIDFTKFLEKEKGMFEKILSVLDSYRLEIVENILNKNVSTEINKQKETLVENNKKEEIKEEVDETQKIQNPDEKESKDLPSSKELPEDNGTNALRTIRFIKPVPSFLGPELEEYGPFDEEEIANLPSKIVSILVKKERAEEITINT